MAQPGDSASSERGSPTRRRRQSAPSATSGDVPLLPALGEPGTTSAQGWGERPFLDVAGAPPLTRGDGWFWLFFGLLGFLAGEIVGFVFAAIAADLAGEGNQLAAIAKLSAPPEWYVGARLVGLWVGFFAGPWLASRVRGTRQFVFDLGLRFRPIDAVGIVIGVGGQILVGLMYLPFRSHIHNFNGPTTKLTGAAHGGGFVVIAVLTVVGAPFFEELFFRGLVLKGLVRVLTPIGATPGRARTLGVAGAVVLDGLIFGLAHGELVQLAGLATFGAILAVISYRTGRLGMNMVAHASFNLVAVLSILSSRGGLIH